MRPRHFAARHNTYIQTHARPPRAANSTQSNQIRMLNSTDPPRNSTWFTPTASLLLCHKRMPAQNPVPRISNSAAASPFTACVPANPGRAINTTAATTTTTTTNAACTVIKYQYERSNHKRTPYSAAEPPKRDKQEKGKYQKKGQKFLSPLDALKTQKEEKKLLNQLLFAHAPYPKPSTYHIAPSKEKEKRTKGKKMTNDREKGVTKRKGKSSTETRLTGDRRVDIMVITPA